MFVNSIRDAPLTISTTISTVRSTPQKFAPYQWGWRVCRGQRRPCHVRAEAARVPAATRRGGPSARGRRLASLHKGIVHSRRHTHGLSQLALQACYHCQTCSVCAVPKRLPPTLSVRSSSPLAPPMNGPPCTARSTSASARAICDGVGVRCACPARANKQSAHDAQCQR